MLSSAAARREAPVGRVRSQAGQRQTRFTPTIGSRLGSISLCSPDQNPGFPTCAIHIPQPAATQLCCRTGSASSRPRGRARPGLTAHRERQPGPVRGHGRKHTFHWATLGRVTKYGAVVLPASGSFQARRLNTQTGSRWSTQKWVARFGSVPGAEVRAAPKPSQLALVRRSRQPGQRCPGWSKPPRFL